jgi:hypothetical protein
VLGLFIEAQLLVRRSQPVPQSAVLREPANAVVVEKRKRKGILREECRGK